MVDMGTSKVNKQPSPPKLRGRKDYEDAESLLIDNFVIMREELGWTQTAVCERLAERGYAFGQPTLARIENGQRPVRLTEFLALADVFGLDPNTLLGGTYIDKDRSERRIETLDAVVQQREALHRLVDDLSAAVLQAGYVQEEGK